MNGHVYFFVAYYKIRIKWEWNKDVKLQGLVQSSHALGMSCLNGHNRLVVVN